MSDATHLTQTHIEISFSETSNALGETPPYSEPVSVQEVLRDGLATVQVANGILRLTFFVERSDVNNNSQAIRPVVARLVMTSTAAAGVSLALTDVLQNMVEKNLIPSLPEVVRK